MKYKILNMADISQFSNVLAPLNDIAHITTLQPRPSLLANRIGEYDAYIATLKVRVDAEVLSNAPRLKVIATPSTGLDHIDMDLCSAGNIAVLSLKEETEFLDSVTATAELAWGLLLSVARHIPWTFQAACNGHWARDEFRGTQLSGKTLGILGLGRLGHIVAQYAHAFRMNVIACDIAPVDPPEYVEMTDFDTLIANSDVLSLHIHLTDDNHHLIHEGVFRQMKSSAILINTSRGAVIDEAALLKALKHKWIAAAGLDVIHGEWDKDLVNHPLVQYAATHNNVVISPHIGGVTYESQRMTLEFIVNKLRAFLMDKT